MRRLQIPQPTERPPSTPGGGGDRRPDRLPGAGPPLLRARRKSHGDRPLPRPAPALRGRGDGGAARRRRSGRGLAGHVLVDKYLFGTEVDVDAVSDGESVVIPVSWSTWSAPACTAAIRWPPIPPRGWTRRSPANRVGHRRDRRALPVRGLCNIQFVIWRGVPHVLEVNPRASRTVPFISKVTGVPMVELATR